MLSYEDCLAVSDLTEEEVEAIAEHERCPEMLALELGNYLIHTPGGSPRVRRIILDDIEEAQRRGNQARVAKLKLTLKHFCENHPEAVSP